MIMHIFTLFKGRMWLSSISCGQQLVSLSYLYLHLFLLVLLRGQYDLLSYPSLLYRLQLHLHCHLEFPLFRGVWFRGTVLQGANIEVVVGLRDNSVRTKTVFNGEL